LGAGLLFILSWLFELKIFWFTTEDGFEWNAWDYSLLVKWGLFASHTMSGVVYISALLIFSGALIVITSVWGRLKPLSLYLFPLSVLTLLAGFFSLAYAHYFFQRAPVSSPAIVQFGWGACAFSLSLVLILGAGLLSKWVTSRSS
jgi:hypothetical protein